MAEHGGQLIFGVHHGQDTGSDEDLASGKRESALEAGVGIEVKTVRELSLRVRCELVAYSLEVSVYLCCLRSGLHAFSFDKLGGQKISDADFVGVGEKRDRVCVLSKQDSATKTNCKAKAHSGVHSLGEWTRCEEFGN